MQIMTPADIAVLIHCAESNPQKVDLDSPGAPDALKGLVLSGLVQFVGNGVYRATERGEAHLRQLCGTPLPVARTIWADEDGEAIRG